MKLTSILMLGACLQVAAHVNAQTVSFSGTNVPLEKVFAAVEKQTGYVFFFDEAILKDARPVTIKAENYSLSLFLTRVLEGQPYKFSFHNKTIVIARKEPEAVARTQEADTARPSPEQFLQGMVMDTNGTPLVGASVTVKGSGKSTITNERGAFSMPAPPAKSKIIVSYVGYTTREIKLAERQQQVIAQLQVAVNVLDEEVVQAYGKTSQRLGVGSIVKVSGEEIQRQPVMNPLLALNGRVPGLLVTPVSGYISSPVKLEIRGRSTINPELVADPLYVIDGVPLTILDVSMSIYKSNYKNGSTGFVQGGFSNNTGGQSPLFSINPADIESISVLKDAAATAIYGSRGANGVILITTKRSQPGKTRLNMQVQQSVSSAPRYWDMLKTPEYLQMRREALQNDGRPPILANLPEQGWDTTRYTDWQKEIWGVAKSTSANMNLTGGDMRTSFTLGAGYNSTEDITSMNGTNERINITSGINHRSPNQKLTIDFKAGYSYTKVKAIQVPNLTTLPPNAPPIFNAKGKLNYAEWNAVGLSGLNQFPFQSMLTPSTNNSNFINTSLRINYNLAKGLSLGILGGYSNAQARTVHLGPIASQNPINNPTGSANFGVSMINNWNVEPQLNYATYAGPGKLEIMAGGTYQNSGTRGITISGFGYTNDALIESVTSAPGQSSGENYAQKKYANIHGRINYNILNKYILELAGNRDGSSNFGPGRQFGNFWSVGAAWIASEEAWAKSLLPSWWSFVKFNASYGVTGLDAGTAYQYLSLWRVPTASQGFPQYNGVVPIEAINAVNQDFQWQVNRKINADLSLGFLDDRITLLLTWYSNRCNNQLTSIPTPAFTGFTGVTGNSPANVLNDGWEGSINARLIAAKNFSWNFGFNISANRNKLVAYPGFEFSPFYKTNTIGESLNTRYLLHYIGLNPQNGKPAFADYNHDGIITNNGNVPPATGNDDRYIAYDPTPRYIGGIGNQFTYKRFMLSLFFNYKKQMGNLPYIDVPGNIGNIPVEVYNDHWRKPGDQTRYTRFATFTSASDANFDRSDGAVTDASFVRLSNLAFSYSLPENICKKLFLQGASLSVNMQNVFTITRYTGIDPETSFGNLPQARIIAGSVSFTF